MITGLQHIHSSFRYLVLLLLLLAVADAIIGWSAGRSYKKTSKLLALGGLIVSHIQLVVGLILYFIGQKGFAWLMTEGVMKSPVMRFYAVEHISMMIISIALITIGYSKAKRMEEGKRKFRTIALFYGVALVIIFAMIPWPFMKEFGTWM